MDESVTIDRNNKLPPAQDYNFLRKEGLRSIEELAGKVWTDYNTHDPGITLLEAMCYALTDLGYRTSFNPEDIIAPADKTVADKWKKIFYTARQALPCNPLTLMDYRKLVIDTDGVRNAWVEISDDYEVLIYLRKIQEEIAGGPGYDLTYDHENSDDILRIRGLYKVFVEYEPDIVAEKKEDDVAAVIWKKLRFHRNLSEDFISVAAIEYEYFPVDAIIQVSEGTDVEMITAKIFKVIFDFFSPPINFYSLEEMLEKKLSPEEIFEGPILNYGFIDAGDLKRSERFKHIHISDIINIISGIEGIIAVKKFAFQSDPKSPFSNFTEWVSSVKDKQKIPRLDIEKSNIGFERSGDRKKESGETAINKDRIKDIFTFLQSGNFKTRLRGAGKDLPLPETTFMDIADYYPFQKHLPEVYGMSEIFFNEKDVADKVAVVTAVFELLAEKTGIHGAKLIEQLLNQEKYKDHIEKMARVIITSPERDTTIAKELIDKFSDEEIHEPSFKKLAGELLGHYDHDHLRHKLHHFIQHQPVYIDPSKKTMALAWLSEKHLQKKIFQVKSKGDVEKLGSVYRKYQADGLGKRKKLILQLRGFLMVFEQILADYLSQLSHIRDIFSFDDNITQTFYPQLVEGINDMESLFIHFKQYKEFHLKMIETPETFGERRNHVLDHLLARLGESLDKYTSFLNRYDGKQAAGRLIDDKIAFLSDYVQISSYRGKGYDYTDINDNWDSNNVEGLKKRICRLLGIKNYKRTQIAPTNLRIEIKIIDNNVERYIVKLTDPENEQHVLLTSIDLKSEEEAVNILTYLLEEGYKYDLYKPEGHGDNFHFLITRLTPENDYKPVAHSGHYKSQAERNTAQEKTRDLLDQFSATENFHILEHILLRPKMGAVENEGSTEEVALLPVEPVPDEVQKTAGLQQDMPYKFRITQVRQQGSHVWKLVMMKNDTEFLVAGEFSFYSHVTRRMEHIREAAASRTNYSSRLVDGYYSLEINKGNTVLAKGKNKFQNEKDVNDEIDKMISFFSYDEGASAVHDDNRPALYADPYSFQISVIFPSWQRRFRDRTFRHLLEKTIYLETPSHIYPHVYWADHNQMREFDEAYEVWVKEMAANEIPATDVVNNMITVLNNLKT